MRFNPDWVLPESICHLMTGRAKGGLAWAQVSLYCARLKTSVHPDGRVSTGECGRLAADITNQFDLSRAGRPVSGFFCSECARRAPPSEDPEGVRLLYVWWAGKPKEEGPMQLRLTGIHADDMGPSGAGQYDDPACVIISKAREDGNYTTSSHRFRLNSEWSREVWHVMCDLVSRM